MSRRTLVVFAMAVVFATHATIALALIGVGNFVWNDLNGNGIQNAGEPGLANVTVQLWNGAKNNLIDATTTDANGFYSLTAPGPGDYRVRVLLPTAQDTFSPKDQTGDTIDSDIEPSGADVGFTAIYTFPANLISIQTIDAGIIKFVPPTPIGVGNFVWNDLNGNGIQNAGEPGLANVTVQLWNGAKTSMIDTTTTNASGFYSLTAPGPGDYRVRVLLPGAQDTFSPKDQTGDTIDSDIEPSGADLGFTAIYTFPANLISIQTIDAGIIKFGPAAQRTFVSPTGSDAQPCSLPAPCRSFGRAIERTAANGEVVVLASAGYGATRIDKPVTITAPEGVYAGISVDAGTGIIVDPGSGRVTLRGLTLNALGGSRGIEFVSGDALYVERCSVRGFVIAGLDAEGGTGASIAVHASTFRDNSTGIAAGLGSSSAQRLRLDDTKFERNSVGLAIRQKGAAGTLHAGSFSGNATAIVVGPTVAGGVAAIEIRKTTLVGNGTGLAVGGTSGTAATATVVASLISGSTIVGLQTGTGGSTIVSGTTIAGNAVGVQQTGIGISASFVDNRMIDNTTNGSFTSLLARQ